MPTDRRTFLQLLTTAAAAASFPSSIARALSIPANNKTGTIEDVEHIVIMMQENRSFDHYFGTLRGVRGYGDPRAVMLPNGKAVWYQPDGDSSYVLPFHPAAPNLGLQFLEDLAHDWTSTHAAWNGGKYDQWVPTKGPVTMAHLTRSDIPYHYALADAFTVCDAYHCSLLGPTDPNRYHMWTGWVGNDGSGQGPVIDNAEAGYDWSTYPERLQAAGVSWKVYQDVGQGLDAAHYWGWGEDAYIGNYGDNSLLYFHQYQNAADSSALAQNARTGTNISASGTLFDQFKNDVTTNSLPQVSWIVAPEAYTEHPNWPANYGAWYVSQMLDALTSNPAVWSKTAFFILYDENDGFFDHMVPPTPPQTREEGISTVDITNEIFTGSATYPVSSYPAGPYGLGVRVPMLIVSPWSKGGYVNSEVFDHTSLIRFIEKRFAHQYAGLSESNITDWRRAVTGDLTSAFNFKTPNDAVVTLPSTVAYAPPDNNRHPDYSPAPPTEQAMPVQEPGTRPARAVPYRINFGAVVNLAQGTIGGLFLNTGKAAAVFQVRLNNSALGPWTYTVGPNAEVTDTLSLSGLSTYDLSVYGPNGFLRGLKGSAGANAANLAVVTIYNPDTNSITLAGENLGTRELEITLLDAYTKETITAVAQPGQVASHSWNLDASFGWYDFTITASSDSTFAQRFAGHLETGQDSVSDPAIGT